MVELLDRRAEEARKIGQEKAKKGQDYYDPGRQRRVLQKVVKSGGGVFPRSGLKAVFTEVMSTCLAIEQPMRVGFLGPETSFTHQAAMSEFGQSAEYVPLTSIPALFTAVEKDQVDYSVVPIENSTGGIIHHTLDMFLDFEVTICNEIMMAISLHLLSKHSLKQIKKIYSHPSPFLQSQNWLAANLPGCEKIEVSSTVQGVHYAMKERHAAAIGSELASKKYKLKILSRNIEDSKENTTRFWVLGHRLAAPSGNDKTSVMFSVKDRAGALHQILSPLAKRGISMTKIESRPTKRKAWEYVFFCDMLGHISEQKIKNALAQVEPLCIYIKVLGSYPREVDVR
jgi:chorismate mutase/prephenate dehydratase